VSDIHCRNVGDRCIVTEAPDVAYVSAELMAEIALGRGRDAFVLDNELTLGVEGQGVGRVRYRVGELASNCYRVTRIT
jgi:hypothetical protein